MTFILEIAITLGFKPDDEANSARGRGKIFNCENAKFLFLSGNAMERTGMQQVKDVRVLLRSFRDQVARLINSGVTDPLKYLEQI